MKILSKSIPLLGEDGIEKLKNSAVAVFGLGGVGSFTAESLARAGVGSLYLVDGDKIDETNINRQLYALHSTTGLYKTEIAEARIADINPDCKVSIYTEFILPDKEGFLPILDYFGNLDFIVDAVDTVALKIALALEAQRRNISAISAAGCGNRLDGSMFMIDSIFKTSGCPLCRVMRQGLKKKGVKNLKVLYSPKPPDISCNPPASVSWTPGIAGLLIAQHVIRSICGV